MAGINVGTLVAKTLKVGTTQVQKMYLGASQIWANWTLNSGQYAYNTFITNRGGFTPGPTTSWSFTAVRPKTMHIEGVMTQFDWQAWCSMVVEVYYVSSGWVTVYSNSVDLAAGGQWFYNFNISINREELATQIRFTNNSRANNDRQYVYLTEWYTK